MHKDRSKPKPIKGQSREKKKELIVINQVSQSLPANYYSDRCPRAPLHRPRRAKHVPPKLNLIPSPADFQDDYLEHVKRRSRELSLKSYSGPAISSYPNASSKFVSRIKTTEPISTHNVSTSRSKSPKKPHSLTALCILSDQSKDKRLSYDRRNGPEKKRFREQERSTEERSGEGDDLDEIDLEEVELPEDEVFVIDSIDL